MMKLDNMMWCNPPLMCCKQAFGLNASLLIKLEAARICRSTSAGGSTEIIKDAIKQIQDAASQSYGLY